MIITRRPKIGPAAPKFQQTPPVAQGAAVQRQAALFGGNIMLQLVDVNETLISQSMLGVTDLNQT